ncbi:hypothetical protein [Azohydromonas lata]|uniref:Uncharacterized protein n=1 Tax=Azohydromonas lata TaxID=45677 RepID=A0ABU5IGE5_9BURK|nr:hypothetical protein [Azohydromonas lata]MDZ5457884.1 hypothetical protein [Azohydromonas lata]
MTLRNRLDRLEAALPTHEADPQRGERLSATVRFILDSVPRGPITVDGDRDAPFRELLQRGDAGALTAEDCALLAAAPECHVPALEVLRLLVKLMDEV